MTDVRVARVDVLAALLELGAAGLSATELNMNPPASGPEVELRVPAPMDIVRSLLENSGIDVLAIRRTMI